MVLGVVAFTLGVICFLDGLIRGLTRGDGAGPQPQEPLWGVVMLVGGLLLWGLGRIEIALVPSPAHQAQGKVVTGALLAVLAGAVLVVLWQFKLGRL